VQLCKGTAVDEEQGQAHQRDAAKNAKAFAVGFVAALVAGMAFHALLAVAFPYFYRSLFGLPAAASVSALIMISVTRWVSSALRQRM